MEGIARAGKIQYVDQCTQDITVFLSIDSILGLG
jgi:hypothetical protein